jgi:ribonuclease Z
MINAVGGAQRMCTEHRVRMTSLTSILLTTTNCSALSGLPGMILSIADGGKAQVRIVGPPGTKSFERSARPFTSRNFFAVNIDECHHEVLTYQHSISVSAIPISSVQPLHEKGAAFKRAHLGDANGKGDDEDDDDDVFISQQLNEFNTRSESSENAFEFHTNQSTELSYLFATPPSRGKFDVVKARELGVPPGKLYSELHNGRSVTLEDGTVVDPDMVVGKGKQPQYIIVLSCSDLSFLAGLSSHPTIRELFELSTCDATSESSYVNLAIHLGPKEVVKHPRCVCVIVFVLFVIALLLLLW